jgi:hypothetical protein
MTDLSQQTEQLIKALTTLDNSVSVLNTTVMIASVVIVALLIIIAFRRRK